MPFANEHAARQRDPGDFKRIVQIWTAKKGIRGLGGPLKSDPGGGVKTQTVRFPADKWTVAEAKKWLKDHDFKTSGFEEATGEESAMRGRLAFKFTGGEPDNEGVFEGHGSVFGNTDLGGEIVMPGAFTDSLAAHAKAGTMPKMLWQHKADEPIGVWIEMAEDKKGLAVKGRLIQEVQRGREAFALMKHKALDGLSIGYQRIESERDEETNTTKLIKLDLWEVSPVTFPMNTEARIADVKTIRDLEGLLRDAGLSRADAKAVASHGFAGLSRRDTDTVDAEAAALLRSIADMVRGKVQ